MPSATGGGNYSRKCSSRIASFGGTGETGRCVLDCALAVGNTVRTLVRDSGTLRVSMIGLSLCAAMCLMSPQSTAS